MTDEKRWLVKVDCTLKLVFREEDPKIAEGRAKQEILVKLGDMVEVHKVKAEQAPQRDP